MEKMSKSEQMIGNTRAKKGVHESLVLRLPVRLVDKIHECLEMDLGDSPGREEFSKRDVLEYAMMVLDRHVMEKTGSGIAIIYPLIDDDNEVLEMLDGEQER